MEGKGFFSRENEIKGLRSMLFHIEIYKVTLKNWLRHESKMAPE